MQNDKMTCVPSMLQHHLVLMTCVLIFTDSLCHFHSTQCVDVLLVLNKKDCVILFEIKRKSLLVLIDAKIINKFLDVT